LPPELVDLGLDNISVKSGKIDERLTASSGAASRKATNSEGASISESVSGASAPDIETVLDFSRETTIYAAVMDLKRYSFIGYATKSNLDVPYVLHYEGGSVYAGFKKDVWRFELSDTKEFEVRDANFYRNLALMYKDSLDKIGDPDALERFTTVWGKNILLNTWTQLVFKDPVVRTFGILIGKAILEFEEPELVDLTTEEPASNPHQSEHASQSTGYMSQQYGEHSRGKNRLSKETSGSAGKGSPKEKESQAPVPSRLSQGASSSSKPVDYSGNPYSKASKLQGSKGRGKFNPARNAN